jgi:hypothetical protein
MNAAHILMKSKFVLGTGTSAATKARQRCHDAIHGNSAAFELSSSSSSSLREVDALHVQVVYCDSPCLIRTRVLEYSYTVYHGKEQKHTHNHTSATLWRRQNYLCCIACRGTAGFQSGSSVIATKNSSRKSSASSWLPPMAV